MAEALDVNKTLLKLDLAGNQIGYDAAHLLAEVLNPVDHSRTAAVHGCTNVACKERRCDGFVRLLQETADALESNSSLGTMHDVQVAHSPESQPLTLTSTF